MYTHSCTHIHVHTFMIRCPPQPVNAGHRVRTAAEAAAQGHEQRDGGPGVDPKGGRERAVPHAASSRHRCSGYDKYANRDMLCDTISVSDREVGGWGRDPQKCTGRD